jgi:hypothetical protein
MVAVFPVAVVGLVALVQHVVVAVVDRTAVVVPVDTERVLVEVQVNADQRMTIQPVVKYFPMQLQLVLASEAMVEAVITAPVGVAAAAGTGVELAVETGVLVGVAVLPT